MSIFNTDVNYIIIDDISFSLINKNFKKTYEIPKGIVKNFKVEDKSYLFYILKKEIKDSDFDNFILISPSDKFIKLNLDIPKINTDEIESMIYYEIEDAIPINVNDYSYVYKHKILEDKINLDITLIERSIIEDYQDIFEKLGKNLKAVYCLRDVISDGSCYFSLNNLVFKEGSRTESIYFDDTYELLESHDLEYHSLTKIAEAKYQEFDENIKEEINNNLRILAFKRLDYLKDNFTCESVAFFGNFILTFTKELIKSDYPNVRFENDLDILKLESDFNFIKEKKDNKIKIFSVILALIALNLTFVLFINANIKKEYAESKKLKNENVRVEKSLSEIDLAAIKDENIQLTEEIEKNKENLYLKEKNNDLINLFLELENKQNDNLFFNYYKLGTNSLFLSGFANNRSDLDNFIESINYENEIKDISIDNNIYNFKIEIYVGGSN